MINKSAKPLNKISNSLNTLRLTETVTANINSELTDEFALILTKYLGPKSHFNYCNPDSVRLLKQKVIRP